MNGRPSRIRTLAGRTGGALALLVAAAFAGSVFGASIDPPSSATPSTAAAKQTPAGKADPVERVEARIKDLHDKLKITSSQEELWSKVADVMRDNAQEMEPLVKARLEHAKTATAVEDLDSFSQLADAHADGLKKFVAAFAPLYASMSDVQKQNADTVFRGHALGQGHAK